MEEEYALKEGVLQRKHGFTWAKRFYKVVCLCFSRIRFRRNLRHFYQLSVHSMFASPIPPMKLQLYPDRLDYYLMKAKQPSGQTRGSYALSIM